MEVRGVGAFGFDVQVLHGSVQGASWANMCLPRTQKDLKIEVSLGKPNPKAPST